MTNSRSPFFSVITCTLNSERFVLENINSVKNEKLSDYEHIFIDGYSKDSTPRIIKNYKKELPKKVRMYQCSPKGVANAFNAGIRKARGIYIIHLNSDDYFYDSNVLYDVSRFLKKYPELDWIFGKVVVTRESGSFLHTIPCLNPNIFGNLKYQLLKFVNYIPHQGVFITRSVFEKYGLFDEKVGNITDYEFWLRIANKTKFLFFDRKISYYRVHRMSHSLNPDTMELVRRHTLNFHKKYSSSLEHLIFKTINYSKLTDLYRKLRYFT
jgi:glycosyltransferase involved in cell wall biosynthesis